METSIRMGLYPCSLDSERMYQPPECVTSLQAGIEVSGIMGTSAGALTGSLFASGMSAQQVTTISSHLDSQCGGEGRDVGSGYLT